MMLVQYSNHAWQHLMLHNNPGSLPLTACLKGAASSLSFHVTSNKHRGSAPSAAKLASLLAGDLSKRMEAFVKLSRAADADDIGDEEAGRHMPVSSNDDEGEDMPGRGRPAGRGRRPDLFCLKQLSKQLLHARACRAIHLVPLEQLQRVLKALDAQLMRGQDKVLHRGDQV
jgi:hypothetical protein